MSLVFRVYVRVVFLLNVVDVACYAPFTFQLCHYVIFVHVSMFPVFDVCVCLCVGPFQLLMIIFVYNKHGPVVWYVIYAVRGTHMLQSKYATEKSYSKEMLLVRIVAIGFW